LAQVGRISGPLLQDNLLRNGSDLAFRNNSGTTQLLYLDVNTGKVGINKNAPIVELNIEGDARSTNWNTTALTSLTGYEISNNNINVRSGNINLNAGTAIRLSNLETEAFQATDNTISTYVSNANIDLRPWQEYELDDSDPFIADLNATLLQVSRGQIGPGNADYEFWTTVLPSGFQRGDWNESGGISIDDVIGFLSFTRGNVSPPSAAYDRGIAIINAKLPNVESLADTNVTGNIHATGNITTDGNIIVGDQNTDSIIINAEVTSNIIPAANNTYALGAPTKRWDYLYSTLINGTNVVTGNFNVSGIDPLTLRQGNIFWVAQNGDDTNVGDHPNGPFKTLKHALDVVDASTQGPVTIHIMPGGYEEELPLVVPSNVTIRGEDFRNTIIRPTSADQSKDVFHLNGETTIQNITIKDFYYDSGNDTGYAFRFAPNCIITSRSPYIQNVTVITQGTTTSASDPRGFASGDAGKGALIDGAAVPSASNEASMLFHSATFITPGVDAITMTNGVRVEWLNSFTYFANRGLYAKNGVTGHLSTDGSTVQYGAEIRSIGSANVYGNKGAEADGNDCIMYLIAHNFAYIGAGKFVDNDPSRSIQANETIELNSGKIYHVSQDHGGDFRIGDQFFVDFDTGTTSLNLTAAQVDSLQTLNITDSNGTTVVTPALIDIGNFRISDNNIDTLFGAINIDAATEIIFKNDVNFKKNLSLTGNISVGRELITFGDTFGQDTIDINADISSDVVPDISGYYNLGSNSYKWKQGYFSEANIADIKFKDTTVTTNISNSDLELQANGTGEIYLPDADLEITNAATVTGSTTLKNTNITGNVVLAGDYNITNDFNLTGNLIVQQNFSAVQATLEKVNIKNNVIETYSGNDNLDIRASGTGNILFDENVTINKNLTVSGTTTAVDLNLASVLADISIGDIDIFDNIITTTNSNSDLDLRSTGSSTVQLEQVLLDGANISSATNITFEPTESLVFNTDKALNLPSGDISQRSQTQGDVRFNTEKNVFELYVNSAVALGGVYSDNLFTSVLAHPTNNTLQLNVANVNVGSFDSDGINIHQMQVEDINIDANTIGTNVSNSDLELVLDGSGDVVIDDITFDDNNIRNTANDAVTLLSNTANGYWKFGGTGTIRIPFGDNSTRPSTPEIGFTRVNTVTNEMESWNGTTWETSAGKFDSISVEDMEDEALVQSLIYG
jgi:hypothetical protein